MNIPITPAVTVPDTDAPDLRAIALVFAVAKNQMRLTFDPAKNQRNIAERALGSELVAELEWHTAIAIEDTRKDYGERRIRVMAALNGRLHVAVVTYRGDATHVISFRKANRTEMRRYEQERGQPGVTP